MKIRVLVVSPDNFDQNAEVEEMLKHKETEIYTLGNLFQALNDEVLSDQNFFFMVDMDMKEHLNGSSILDNIYITRE